MKKKILRKKVVNKKMLVIVIALCLLGSGIFGVTRIIGQNKVNVVCEDKKGNLFVPRDKSGNIDQCKKHSESVVFDFNNGTGGTSGGSVIGSGDVLFVDGNTFLKKDGIVWSYLQKGDNPNSSDPYFWKEDPSRKTPTGVDVNKIIQWNKNSLLTSDGIYYLYDQYGVKGWILMEL